MKKKEFGYVVILTLQGDPNVIKLPVTAIVELIKLPGMVDKIQQGDIKILDEQTYKMYQLKK